MLKRIIASTLIAVGGTASAQILSASFDILDGADPGAPTPAGVVVIDGFVDVADIAGAAWTASGIRVRTFNGATLRYQMVDPDGDLNSPGIFANVLVNTGSGNDRFVSSISRPRARNAAARFDNAAAAPAGDYDPAGPNPPTTEPTELNCAFFASPPMSAADMGVDGYVIRIGLDTPGLSPEGMVLSTTPPTPHPILLATISGVDDGSQAPGWVNATFNNPTPEGISMNLYWIPEPASLTLLALGALAFRRR